MPAKKRLLMAEDLYRFLELGNVRLSPDGQFVVYRLKRVDAKTEKKYANLWVVPTTGGAPRQFTYGDQSDVSPCWSPDGQTIAFLSNRANAEKPPQIYLLPFGGGESRPLTQIKGEIDQLCWSPDGKKIACTVRKLDPEAWEREEDEQKKKLGVVERHYDRLFYKLDGYGYLPHERTHVWVVDARSGKAHQLTDSPVFDELNPAWSPDGKHIAFISNRQPDPDMHYELLDLFVMPAEGGEARLVPTPPGPKSMPVFSPDGRWIAYYGQVGEGLGFKNNSLWVVAADGSQPAVNLTERYDAHVSVWTINDLGSVEEMAPVWSNDGRWLYYPVAEHGCSLLRRISVDGSLVEDVAGAGGVVSSFTFDREQKKLAYFWGQMQDTGQVYVQELENGQARCLTEVNRALLDSFALGQVEEVWYKGPDGNDLQGWIMFPPDFDPAQKYPSVLQIHGGPLTQYGNFFMFEFNILASQGYVVYFTNPRGGRGYGEAHAGAIWGAWGSVDYADLMAWNEVVASRPYIDPERMGVAGGSYGGYMTLWAIGHTHRFKAAVAMRCVSNFISEWGSSDYNWTFEQELRAGPPFQDLQKYWDMSPIKYIGNVVTPTLVIHNEMDLRCPIEQGEQVFVALKRQKIDTEMVRFPDEPHGLSRNGRTDRRVARLKHILRWFDKYMK
jgi:dipeptidyl aminopeptidase/acylaminoacyl peptidase